MWNSYKIKECKNVTIKQVTKVYQVRNTIALYWNFGISTALILWRYKFISKYRLIVKHLLQRKLQYGGWKNLKVTTNIYKKRWFPVIKWNEKYSSKQVVSITCTLEEKNFRSCYFWRFASRFFWDRVKNLAVYFGLYQSSLYF